MKFCLLYYMFMLLNIPLYAQSVNQPNDNYWTVKWNHLGGVLQNPGANMIVLGVERRVNKYGICFQAGRAIPIAYTRDTFIHGRTSGFTIRLDGKMYRVSRKPHRSDFDAIIGAEMFYTQFSSTSVKRIEDSLNYQNYYQDTVLIQKKMLGIALLFGAQHRAGKHILLQVYTGLGIKIKNVAQEGDYTVKPGYKIDYNPHNPGIDANAPGTRAALASLFHFSVGYRFR